jgi:hypothetical protein
VQPCARFGTWLLAIQHFIHQSLALFPNRAIFKLAPKGILIGEFAWQAKYRHEDAT